jgi:hypothetical protein
MLGISNRTYDIARISPSHKHGVQITGGLCSRVGHRYGRLRRLRRGGGTLDKGRRSGKDPLRQEAHRRNEEKGRKEVNTRPALTRSNSFLRETIQTVAEGEHQESEIEKEKLCERGRLL